MLNKMWNKLCNREVKWLYDITNTKKRYVGILVLLQTLLSVSGVVYALLLRNGIDEAVAKNRNGFFLYVGIIIGVVVVQIAMRAVDRYLEEYLRSSLENACKARLFQSLLRKDFASVTNVHSAEWMNRLTSDTVVCANGIVEILPRLIGLVVKMVAAFSMILVLEPNFVWILVPGGIIMILFTYVFRRVLKKLHKDVQEKDGKLRVLLQEHISSLLVLKAFAAEEQSGLEAVDKMKAHQGARLRRTRFSNICNTGFSVAMNGIYLLGGVAYCGYGILMGTISYGTFTAILQLIGQIQSPFANITGFLPRYYAMVASAERLMEVETFEDDCSGRVKALPEIQDFYRNEFESIDLEHIDFTYRPLDGCEDVVVVLKDLSMSIKKGDYVALTGQSGCGKSTVLKLLMSLYPLDAGMRKLTSKRGNDELTSEWRRLFSYVPQGNHLMCGTIRELVSFADRDATDETATKADARVMKALEISCAIDFVTELEAGLDTVLGEKGHGLSEGQMQRLAIARAVFSDSPILLLDEATSALDEETERKVLDNLKSMTDKTVIIVTHRMKALEICNKVAHFTEQGVAVENK